jgi:hypothetical protein
MVERVKSKPMTDRVNNLVCDIEASIKHDQVVVDKMFDKKKECLMTAIACRRKDDLEPITAFRIYDTTSDYEYEYMYIQPEDPDKMKDRFNNPEYYDYLLEAEHDPDELIALGYEPVLGIADVYTKHDLKHSDGTFYRTSSNGGFFTSDQLFTYYCDGFTIWLKELDGKYRDDLTFGYDNRLYIKITDQRKNELEHLKELHEKVATLQKEVAMLKKNSNDET